MNRKDLINSLVKKFELSKVKSDEIIKHILDSIRTSLVKSKAVKFIGFGTFNVKKRAAKKGRNPQTGEKIKVPARKVVRFTVGKTLKNAVNKK